MPIFPDYGSFPDLGMFSRPWHVVADDSPDQNTSAASHENCVTKRWSKLKLKS